MIAIALAIVAGIVWAVRIEGKVLSHDRDILRMQADAAQWRQDMRAELAVMREDLRYIRERIDQRI